MWVSVRRQNQGRAKIYTTLWVKVLYDREEQIRRVQGFLDSLLHIFAGTDISNAMSLVSSHPIVGRSALQGIIGDMLLDEIARFKDSAFDDEREWRIIVRQRKLMKQGSDDGAPKASPIYFRASNGFIVPYVKILPGNSMHRLPISFIRSGPGVEDSAARRGVRMLLEANNFQDVTVKDSGISLRS